ncbi:hypothetical protein RB614_27465 [Phytohabitans sp. ZYX-F-186]|uniref:Uncharacterized protein n=1 Tax=Phytohabitans maris TaxID=3071409 RepID=A0ABU0ZNM4_9ACTN|nr:hypothetical protein [Phytohabitans sp. ZYX-F-186]MDQ7908271.1 hypothetical protein [Phytohabitans sp. ZYX-F-186]
MADGVLGEVCHQTGETAGSHRAILTPWAKAGLVVKDGTRAGSSYAAVMLTGAHGVRMQHDYVHDRAGSTGGGPRWLRLTRSGDTVTGAESADGAQWTDVGSVRLSGLPSTVEIGLFATSPQYAETVDTPFGTTGVATEPSRLTATFDHVDPAGDWTGTVLGGARARESGGYERDGDRFTLRGTGDIAPAVAGATGLGTTITQTLAGTFAAFIVMVVVGALTATGEYRRGLIRTALAATPGRGRVLAAKALVVGCWPCGRRPPCWPARWPSRPATPEPPGLASSGRRVRERGPGTAVCHGPERNAWKARHAARYLAACHSAPRPRSALPPIGSAPRRPPARPAHRSAT